MKDILEAVKKEDPEMGDLLSEIEPFLTEKGFNSSDFEKVLRGKLESIPNEVKLKITESDDSKD